MKTVLTVAALVIALGAAGFAFYSFFERERQMARLNDTINALESRLASSEQLSREAKEASEAPAMQQAVEKGMADLQEKVEAFGKRVELMDTHVSALRQSEKQSKAQIAKFEEKVGSIANGPGDAARMEKLESMINEKLKDAPLGKKPALGAVAARIELEKDEQAALENILLRKKQDVMAVLKTPREDGSNLLDEFVDDLITIMSADEPDPGDGAKAYMKLFGRLATEKVPGTSDTYLGRLGKIEQDTRDVFKETLSEKKYRAFEALGIENITEIKIPDEPIDKYVQQRLEAAGTGTEK